jgi:predicted DCC family thiol-disulfide oxidoreductase YuxK
VNQLAILYDADCALCVGARAWLERQPRFVPLEFVAATSVEAARRFGGVPVVGRELVVVADDGRVWIGPSAFVMCLWSLRASRGWALRLAHPALAPIARRFFPLLSDRRRARAAWLGHRSCAHGRCGAPYR